MKAETHSLDPVSSVSGALDPSSLVPGVANGLVLRPGVHDAAAGAADGVAPYDRLVCKLVGWGAGEAPASTVGVGLGLGAATAGGCGVAVAAAGVADERSLVSHSPRSVASDAGVDVVRVGTGEGVGASWRAASAVGWSTK